MLHTYLAVGDIRKAFVQGFNGATYVTDNEATKGTFTDDRQMATIAAETDRIYFKCPGDLVLSENGGRDGGALALKRLGELFMEAESPETKDADGNSSTCPNFYMVSQFGLQGTCRPTHYHVLCNDCAAPGEEDAYAADKWHGGPDGKMIKPTRRAGAATPGPTTRTRCVRRRAGPPPA